MAGDFNQNRVAKAKLGTKTVNVPSVSFAFEDGYDGYREFKVSSLPTVELFIGQGTQQHEDILDWTLFTSQNNYGGIGANAFNRFPNMVSITLYQEQNEDLVIIDDNAFSSNADLDKIYVHPDKLLAYQTQYAGKSFVSFFEAYPLTSDYVIPTSYNGNVAPITLTKAWLDLVTANMPLLARNVKINLIVPSYFTGIDVGAFSGLGTRFINLQELKCQGIKTFASGFLNGASWCKHLWVENGSCTLNSPYCTDDTTIYTNFRVVAPYLVFANYFMQEHNIKTDVVCPIIGYNQFTSGASLPQASPTGEYLWFSNINFNADFESPTGLENDPSFIDDYEAPSSAYYYCYDKTETLVIQGSGTLTSAIVESAINGLDTPKEWITKVVVPATFTAVNDNPLNALSSLPNLANIEINDNIQQSDFDLLNFGSSLFGSANNYNIKINVVVANRRLSIKNTFYAKLIDISGNYTYSEQFGNKLEPRSSVKINSNVQPIQPNKLFRLFYSEKVYIGNTLRGIAYRYSTPNIGDFQAYITNPKLYFEKGDTTTKYLLDEASFKSSQKIYFSADELEYYMTATDWSTYNNKFIGYLDYTDTIPTFSGYTDQWYEDEDCTTPIATTDFVSGTRYFVKLTAI